MYIFCKHFLNERERGRELKLSNTSSLLAHEICFMYLIGSLVGMYDIWYAHTRFCIGRHTQQISFTARPLLLLLLFFTFFLRLHWRNYLYIWLYEFAAVLALTEASHNAQDKRKQNVCKTKREHCLIDDNGSNEHKYEYIWPFCAGQQACARVCVCSLGLDADSLVGQKILLKHVMSDFFASCIFCSVQLWTAARKKSEQKIEMNMNCDRDMRLEIEIELCNAYANRPKNI